MPKIFQYKGYDFYLWSNENNEPIHIHLSKKKPSANAAKVWLMKDGTSKVDEKTINKNNIEGLTIKEIENVTTQNRMLIYEKWIETFKTGNFKVK